LGVGEIPPVFGSGKSACYLGVWKFQKANDSDFQICYPKEEGKENANEKECICMGPMTHVLQMHAFRKGIFFLLYCL
jgi:hypothetical protein